MTFNNVKFAIFCCLLAGFSSVRGDDKSAAAASSTHCCRKPIKQRGCCHNGIYIREGQTKTIAPCQYGTCNRGRVNIAIADCAPLPSGCRYESTMEYCCKKICDVGCTHNGILISEGETKTVAPCEFASCINGELAIMVADCPPPEKGCRFESTMDYCCKKICNVGCKYNGTIILEGETLKIAPCEYATCMNGEIGIAIQDCARPREGCRYEPTMENCCNMICDGGCTYFEELIPEGETLKIAPCEYATCMNGEIGTAIQDCARPREGCRYEPTMENCCNMICDGGCTYFGEFIPDGETYTIGPCQYATCINGEVELAVASCPRPQPGCRYESTLEECCKTICDEIVIAPDVE